MPVKPHVKLLLVLLVLVCAARTMHADTVPGQLYASVQLSPNDISLGIASTSQPVGYVSPGNSISFITGDQLVFSRTSGHFEVDQAGYNYGGTAFSNGTNLVGAGGFQGPGDGGPITLTFTVPVEEFGLNIEEFDGGNYTVKFTAYDANGHVILSNLSSTGNDPISGSGGAGCLTDAGCLSFEGVLAAQDPLTALYPDPIARVTFDDSASGGSNDLLFGNIKYAPLGTALQAPPAVTPEPPGLILLGTGLVSLVCLGRRATSKLSNNSAR